MTYHLNFGLCFANKSDVDWYAGEAFCKSIHPGVHLIDIRTEAEQDVYQTILGRNLESHTTTTTTTTNNNNNNNRNNNKPTTAIIK